MIQLKHVNKKFEVGRPAEVTALDDVTLDIHDAEFVILLGSNGSGKSTLLNAIAGSISVDSGSISIEHNDVTSLSDYQRSRWVARIFQNPMHGTSPELTVLENFRLAALRTSRKTLSIGTTASFRRQTADTIAELGMGLESKLDQPMGTLSGGQRQALALLMAVMAEPKILLLDEPAAALDPRTAERIMELANGIIRKHGLTAVLITHQLKDAIRYGDRVILLSEGRISRDLSGERRKTLSPSELLEWFGV